MRWILIFVVVSFNIGWLYAQPGPIFRAGPSTSYILFQTDTNVKVNNNLLVNSSRVRGKILSRCDTCKVYLSYRNALTDHWGVTYRIPIIDSNNYPIGLLNKPFYSDIDSIYKDSNYCNLRLQLIKNEDTMNIMVNNIVYETSVKNHKTPFMVYHIRYIPFMKGNFRINVKNQKKAINNHNTSPYIFTDITPKSWTRQNPFPIYSRPCDYIRYRTESNVKVNNNFFISKRPFLLPKGPVKYGVLPRCNTCEHYLTVRDSIAKIENEKDKWNSYWYKTPIIDFNNTPNAWLDKPFKSDIDSVYKNSNYCNFRLQLIKGGDTMNILIKNIVYEPSVNNSRVPYTAYVIKKIPFIKGNFCIQVKNQNKEGNYRNIYDKIENSSLLTGIFNYWNITPENWEKLRVKK